MARATAWLAAAAMLGFCSCRGPNPMPVDSCPPQGMAMAPSPALPPPMAMAPGAAPGAAIGPPGMERGIPLPYAAAGPWMPPGFGQPWPADEYLEDGGDQVPHAVITPDRELRGLNLEDTVAHYDTLGGCTMIEPSNRVHIYSPRFAAVRQVVSLRQNEQHDPAAGIYLPASLAQHAESLPANSSKQNIMPEGQIGQDLLTTYESWQGHGVLGRTLSPQGFKDFFKPYEDFQVIRYGQFVMAEMPFLAQATDAAIVWSNVQKVQIQLNGQNAVEAVKDVQAGVIYTVDEPPARPKLRLIKVASTQFAEPGDTIDFTLRFDNVGNQPINNVTILDSLTTRLEYVPDTAQSSRDAAFSVVQNEGESLMLRWQLDQPLKPGEGGVLRFTCKVR